jgi:hypothetical protein
MENDSWPQRDEEKGQIRAFSACVDVAVMIAGPSLWECPVVPAGHLRSSSGVRSVTWQTMRYCTRLVREMKYVIGRDAR